MSEFKEYYEVSWTRMEYVCASGQNEPIRYAKQFDTKEAAKEYYAANKHLTERINWDLTKRNCDHVISHYKLERTKKNESSKE